MFRDRFHGLDVEICCVLFWLRRCSHLHSASKAWSTSLMVALRVMALMPIAGCLLHTAYCLLSIACCRLPTTYCLHTLVAMFVFSSTLVAVRSCYSLHMLCSVLCSRSDWLHMLRSLFCSNAMGKLSLCSVAAALSHICVDCARATCRNTGSIAFKCKKSLKVEAAMQHLLNFAVSTGATTLSKNASSTATLRMRACSTMSTGREQHFAWW